MRPPLDTRLHTAPLNDSCSNFLAHVSGSDFSDRIPGMLCEFFGSLWRMLRTLVHPPQHIFRQSQEICGICLQALGQLSDTWQGSGLCCCIQTLTSDSDLRCSSNISLLQATHTSSSSQGSSISSLATIRSVRREQRWWQRRALYRPMPV